MKKVEVEVLSEQINGPVIKLPSRKYPGIVLPGDSLKILYSLSEELYEACLHKNDEELVVLSEEIRELLINYLSLYEYTLRTYNLELPYASSLIPLIPNKK